MKYLENPPVNENDRLEVNDMVDAWIELIGVRHLINQTFELTDEIEEDAGRQFAIDELMYGLDQVNNQIEQINIALNLSKKY